MEIDQENSNHVEISAEYKRLRSVAPNWTPAQVRESVIESFSMKWSMPSDEVAEIVASCLASAAIRAYLRQACEHKIALHVDAALDDVDTDPEEADAWAYEAGKEAWEFDLPVPEKLASHPALSAAFKRGFESVDQQSRSQREVENCLSSIG